MGDGGGGGCRGLQAREGLRRRWGTLAGAWATTVCGESRVAAPLSPQGLALIEPRSYRAGAPTLGPHAGSRTGSRAVGGAG